MSKIQQELTRVEREINKAKQEMPFAKGDRREYLQGRLDGLSVYKLELTLHLSK